MSDSTCPVCVFSIQLPGPEEAGTPFYCPHCLTLLSGPDPTLPPARNTKEEKEDRVEIRDGQVIFTPAGGSSKVSCDLEELRNRLREQEQQQKGKQEKSEPPRSWTPPEIEDFRQRLASELAAEPDTMRRSYILERHWQTVQSHPPPEGAFMWISPDPLPEHWEYCNGRDDTPDLKHLALMLPGVGMSYPVRRKR